MLALQVEGGPGGGQGTPGVPCVHALQGGWPAGLHGVGFAARAWVNLSAGHALRAVLLLLPSHLCLRSSTKEYSKWILPLVKSCEET